MKKKNTFYFLLVFLLTIPVILPFLRKGYFPSHDGEWAVVRLADMYRTVKDLQFPARFSGYLNSGYGYPLFNFAYPFPYYLGLIPLFLGFGLVDSIKFLFAISLPLSALFMFLLSRKLWDSELAGLASAILYIYLPYRFVDLFVRGSIGESLSFIFFPLLFYLILKLSENIKNINLIILSGMMFAVLILTHNIMTLLFTPVLTVFSLLLYKISKHKKSYLKSLILVLFLGLSLSFFFWFPALYERKLIRLSEVPIADRNLYFVSLPKLIFPNWGFAPPTEKNGFSYQIGLPQIFILIISGLYLLVKIWRKEDIRNTHSLFGFVFFTEITIAIFLLFKESSFFWQRLPLFSEINYPWTLLSQIGFLISLLSGFLITKSKAFKYLIMFLSLSAFILHLSYARPEKYINKGDDFYLTNDATTTSSDELMPLWVKEKPRERFKEKVESSNKAKIIGLTYSSKMAEFTVAGELADKIRINTLYYPNWEVLVDGKARDVNYNNNYGVMEFDISPGRHQVKAFFRETPLRLAADILSLFSLIVCVLLFASRKARYAIHRIVSG